VEHGDGGHPNKALTRGIRHRDTGSPTNLTSFSFNSNFASHMIFEKSLPKCHLTIYPAGLGGGLDEMGGRLRDSETLYILSEN
jgi:hypothetical protein